MRNDEFIEELRRILQLIEKAFRPESEDPVVPMLQQACVPNGTMDLLDRIALGLKLLLLDRDITTRELKEAEEDVADLREVVAELEKEIAALKASRQETEGQ
jgi:hypothetical protein